MSFDSEWSQLKADAAGQQSAHTRRNRDGSAVSVSEISEISEMVK
ncbi:hypothetical protein [Streptomyces milbemycinicus]|uniref:Uncharacterized protein n=1 Tax=Streptomyces milbemycinicus TaxID=476552 RepID=A0ABW8LGT8_9ACTN